jgi:formylglycine-generating enzyme required for sulfatase activity
MVEHRRAGSDDGAAERRRRASELFAEWLAEHDEPRELDEARFVRLIEANPELRDELQSLRRGLESFRSIRPSRLRSALDAEARPVVRRIWTIRVAAAALLVAAVGLIWRYASRREAPPPYVTSPLAAAIVDRGLEWMNDMAQRGKGVDKILQDGSDATAGGRAAKTPAPLDPRVEKSASEAVHGVAGVYSTVSALAGGSGRSVVEPVASALEGFRNSLLAAEPESWRRRLLATVEAPRIDDEPGAPFLFALSQDPKIRALIAETGATRPDSEVLAGLIAKVTNRAVLRVRAVDLDAGGQARSGAVVYAQPILLPESSFGPVRRLGVTPLAPCQLECGDWRLTVVDASGAEPRFSELRILAMPGVDLGLRVAFLRATADVTVGMAHRDECTAYCGWPPDNPAAALDCPQTASNVEELWIDPCEVTCTEYSDFYLDLQRHPQWFDGPVPVHCPAVLEKDGSCPPAMARRAIVDVTWDECVLYANWAGKRLPTQREWERVARGSVDENRKYPWGNEEETARVNTSADQTALLLKNLGKVVYPPAYESLTEGEVDAAAFAAGATPPGSGDPVYRLADNVSEYVEDLFVADLGSKAPHFIIAQSVARVAKGGSWNIGGLDQSITWKRIASMPWPGSRSKGFRCLKTPRPGFAIQ